MGPVHPSEPINERLAQFISRMPGGRYIGEQWRTEPKLVVGVDVSDYEQHTTLLDDIMASYPPRLIEESREHHWGRSYLFHVPETVAGILVHYTLVDAAEAEVYAVPREDLQGLGEVDDHLLDRIAQMWTPGESLDSGLKDAVERLDAAREAAEDLGVETEKVIETVMRLWEEAGRNDYYRVLEMTEAVLA